MKSDSTHRRHRIVLIRGSDWHTDTPTHRHTDTHTHTLTHWNDFDRIANDGAAVFAQFNVCVCFFSFIQARCRLFFFVFVLAEFLFVCLFFLAKTDVRCSPSADRFCRLAPRSDEPNGGRGRKKALEAGPRPWWVELRRWMIGSTLKGVGPIDSTHKMARPPAVARQTRSNSVKLGQNRWNSVKLGKKISCDEFLAFSWQKKTDSDGVPEIGPMGALERRPTWKTHRFKESLGTDQSEWSYGVPRVRRGRNGFQAKRIEFLFFSYFFFQVHQRNRVRCRPDSGRGCCFFLQPRICFLSQKKKTCKKKREMEKEWIIGPCDPFCFPFFCALSLFLFRDESNYFTRRAVQKKMKKKKKKRFDKQKPKQQSE